jgi:hypothetical protein
VRCGHARACAVQPLMDNLESQTYETFEKDPVKYVQYEKASARSCRDRPRSSSGLLTRERRRRCTQRSPPTTPMPRYAAASIAPHYSAEAHTAFCSDQWC